MSTPLHAGPARPRGDVWFLFILVVLSLLAAFFWLREPGRYADAKSRVPWTAPRPHQK